MRLKNMTTIFSVLLALLLLPMPLAAYDLNEKIQLHGFASQGYLDSAGNNFLSDSLDGTFAFNEIGLNLNLRFSDQLRFGGQILSRKMGSYGDNSIRLDWGLADYRFQDWAGIRAGKVKIPLGLYNTERDSDFLRPMIFLPQSIYDETRRDTWLAHWGGELYGNVAREAFGDFDYKLFYGRIKYEGDSVYHDSTLDSINRRLADNLTDPNPDSLLPPTSTNPTGITITCMAQTSSIPPPWRISAWESPMSASRIPPTPTMKKSVNIKPTATLSFPWNMPGGTSC